MTSTTGTTSGLRRGQVAAAADVNIETLRYYERRGLLAEPDRSPGGHRLYPPEAVTVLRVIMAAQRLGFTLDEVTDLLELGQHRHGRRLDAGLQRRAREKLVEVEERINDLVTIRDNLTAAVDADCDDLLACAAADCCPIPFEGITLHPESQYSGSQNSGLLDSGAGRERAEHPEGSAAGESAPRRWCRAACAVCCAAPLVGFLGVAGLPATAVTIAFAGVVFAVVIGLAALAAVWARRSWVRRASCVPPPGAERVMVGFGPTRRSGDG